MKEPKIGDEFQKILGIAIPVACTAFCRVAMEISDMAFVGHLVSTDALAATSLAQVWMSCTSLFLYRGMSVALQTLVSQAKGAKNFELCGIWLQVGILLVSISCIPVILAWNFTSMVIKLFPNVNIETAQLAGTYAQVSSLYLPPLMLYNIMAYYFQSLGVVWSTVWINFTFIFVNAGLNLLFINGYGNWEGLGFVGSPLATVITRWLLFLTFWVYNFILRKNHKVAWGGLAPKEACKSSRIKTYLAQCLPLAIGTMVEDWQLQVITMFAGSLGVVAVSVHSSVLEIYFLFTSVTVGFTTASVIRIAFHLGNSDIKSAKVVARLSYIINGFLGAVVAVVFFLFRRKIGAIFDPEADFIRLMSVIITIVGCTYAFMSLFYSSMAVLRGQGRPNLIAVGFVVGAWVVSVPMAYLTIFQFHMHLDALWYSMVAGYVVITCIALFGVWRSDWEQVVEDTLIRAEKKSARQPLLPATDDGGERRD